MDNATTTAVYELAKRLIDDRAAGGDWWQIPFWIAVAFKRTTDTRPSEDDCLEVAAALETDWQGQGTFSIEEMASQACSLWRDVRDDGAIVTAIKRAIAEPAAVEGTKAMRIVVAYARDVARVHQAFVIPQKQIAAMLGHRCHRTIGRAVIDAVADGHIAVVDETWSYSDRKGKLYCLAGGYA